MKNFIKVYLFILYVFALLFIDIRVGTCYNNIIERRYNENTGIIKNAKENEMRIDSEW